MYTEAQVKELLEENAELKAKVNELESIVAMKRYNRQTNSPYSPIPLKWTDEADNRYQIVKSYLTNEELFVQVPQISVVSKPTD